MGIRNIVKEGDDILSKISKPIETITEKEINLIKDMKETLGSVGGVGLAAVQVGVLKRIFILKVPFTDDDEVVIKSKDKGFIKLNPAWVSENEKSHEKNKTQNDQKKNSKNKNTTSENIDKYFFTIEIINPEISNLKGETFGYEACLSVPELNGEVPRYTSLTLKGIDADGDEVIVDCKNFVARAVQHEYDHLDGILFTSKAVNVVNVEKE